MLFNEHYVMLSLGKVLKEGFRVVEEPSPLGKDIADIWMPHTHRGWELKICSTAGQGPPYTVYYTPPGRVHASSKEPVMPLEISHQRIRIGHINLPPCKYYVFNDETMRLNIMPDLLLALMKIDGHEDFAAMQTKLMSAVLENLLTLTSLLSENHQQAMPSYLPTEKALDYMHSNYFNPALGVADIARYAGVSPQYLNRIFMRKTGKTTRQMLVEIRLARAKELLEENTFFIKEVALLTGWRCPYYFSNCFSKHYGMPPSSKQA